MRIGVCGGAERVRSAFENGLDYIEPAFSTFASEDDGNMRALLAELDKYDIGCESCNCFLPWDVKATGPDVPYEYLRAYFARGFSNAAAAGVKTVVFGSGGPRSVPDGYPYAKACRDLVRLTKHYVAPAAAKNGIRVVFEPLRKAESNIINNVKEGSTFAALVDEPNIGCLADLFHMAVEGDTFDNIRAVRGGIWHGHISHPETRKYMKDVDEYDYIGFFRAMEEAGCERISIEAGFDDYEKDIVIAADVMKKLRDML